MEHKRKRKKKFKMRDIRVENHLHLFIFTSANTNFENYVRAGVSFVTENAHMLVAGGMGNAPTGGLAALFDGNGNT